MLTLRTLIGASLLGLFVTTPLYADISINIGLPSPPVVKLSVPPPMVWLPGPRLYVAHGSPQPIFYIGGQYYFFGDGRWYVGPGYAGPWGHIKGKKVPPGLRKFRASDWNGYQREARKHRGNAKTFQAKGGKPAKAAASKPGKLRQRGDRGKGGGNHKQAGHGRGKNK